MGLATEKKEICKTQIPQDRLHRIYTDFIWASEFIRLHRGFGGQAEGAEIFFDTDSHRFTLFINVFRHGFRLRSATP